jgi:hypothetical protein
VASVLDDLARERPVALILDDLHWVDEGSLRLLRFLTADPCVATGSGRLRVAGPRPGHRCPTARGGRGGGRPRRVLAPRRPRRGRRGPPHLADAVSAPRRPMLSPRGPAATRCSSRRWRG